MYTDQEPDVNAEVLIPEQYAPGGWIIGPPSRLLDVWSPTPILMKAPAFSYKEHHMSFQVGPAERMTPPRNRSLKHTLRPFTHKSQCITVEDSKFCYDCRHDSTANIAHVIQYLIGVALYALEAVGLESHWRDLRFILHKNTPDYSIDLFKALGFEVILTDGPVSGNFISTTPTQFPYRPLASEILRKHAVSLGILNEHDTPLDPIFIARRGRRSLINQNEVESALNKAGYRTVYPEDLKAEEQIRTVSCAPKVVGLHGAALSYLMFRDPSMHGTLIECFSCSYATNWARSITSHKNMSWIGCMGKFNFDTMKTMQNEAHPRKHEADNYYLHTNTLRTALNAIDMPGSIDTNIQLLNTINVSPKNPAEAPS